MASENNKSPQFLVCVDGKEESFIALHFACRKAMSCGGEVNLLNVIEPVDGQSIFSVNDKIKGERIHEAKNILADFSFLAESLMDKKPNIIIKEGNVGAEIIKSASCPDLAISMMVLGAVSDSAGHGRLISWLSAQMGDELHVPIMIVPGNLSDEEIDRLA